MRQKRADKAFIEDMLESCDAIIEYTSGLTYDAFKSDRKTLDAVMRRFTILGEAATKLNSEFRSLHPAIPWRSTINMRNVLIHFYHGADTEVVWRTIKENIPELKEKLAQVFKNLA